MIRRVWTFAAVVLAAAFVLNACSSPEGRRRAAIERGDAYRAKRQFNDAILEYRRAAQADPRSSEPYVRLGDVAIEIGDKLNAWQSYAHAADLSPSDSNLQIHAGGVFLLAHKFDDARVRAERVLETDPKNVRALILRANALAGLQNLDTAIQLVKDVIRMNPGNAEWYSNLAAMEATTGQFHEAEATFQRAVEVAPKAASGYMALGNFYWGTRRPRQAEALLLKAIEIEPKNVLANRALATFYLGSGQPLKAEGPLKVVVAASPGVDERLALADYYLLTSRRDMGLAMLSELAKRPDGFEKAQARLAALRLTEGNPQAATAIVKAVLERSPRSPEALLIRARLRLGERDYQGALKDAAAAAEVAPLSTQALYLEGQLYAMQGDYSRASQAYKGVLKLNPIATPAKLALVRLDEAQGANDVATDALHAVLQSSPGDPSVVLMLVSTLLERRDLAAAEPLLKRLLNEYPSAAPVQTLAGTLSLLKKDFAGARRYYQGALQTAPGSLDALSGLIAVDLATHRQDDALASVQRALAGEPSRTSLRLLLAKVYGARHDLRKAEIVLRETIAADPLSFEAYGMLAQLLYQSGRLEDGKQAFEKVLERQPHGVPALTMIGIILEKQGKRDEAIDMYRRALSYDKNAAIAANNLAWIYAERGTNLEDAVILARTARQWLPDRPAVSDTLGWAYYRNGEPKLAKLSIPYLQECVENDPRNPLYRYHLGAALARTGDVANAREQLKTALTLSTTFHGVAETRRLLASLD